MLTGMFFLGSRKRMLSRSFHFKGDRLVAVDSINRPADHMIARRLLAAEISPSEADIMAGMPRLKELLAVVAR